jgi:hypothetical protein
VPISQEAGMIRSHRVVAPAAALVCALLAVAVAAAAEDGKASFWVEDMSLDLGTVVAGETATGTFVFHNDGPEDVKIIRAKPS